MIVIHSARGSRSEQIRIPNAVTQYDRENSKIGDWKVEENQQTTHANRRDEVKIP